MIGPTGTGVAIEPGVVDKIAGVVGAAGSRLYHRVMFRSCEEMERGTSPIEVVLFAVLMMR